MSDEQPKKIWYEVSVERVQVVTYKRKVRAASIEEAISKAAEETAHPSAYDDWYGAVLDRKDPVVVPLPEDHWLYRRDADYVKASIELDDTP